MKPIYAKWHRPCQALLIAYILYQYTVWLTDYWLLPTENIVRLTLFAGVAIELIAGRYQVLSKLLQLFSVPVITILVLQQPWPVTDPEANISIWTLANQYAHELLPYIWFGFAASAIFIVIPLWLSRKDMLYMFVFTSISGLAVADSFTKVILWDQIAIVLFCCLMLLAADHFRRLQTSNPDAWRQLVRSPNFILLPFMLISVLVLGAGFASTDIRPLLNDPYTLWKKSQGEEVNSSGKPGDSSASKDDSGSSSASGYRRNDNQLGGDFNFDYSPIMTIATTRGAYWRGESVTFYNGRGWDDNSEPLVSPVGSAVLPIQERIRPTLLKTMEIKQTVTMLKESAYPVLFGAYSINRVTSVNGKNGAKLFASLSWTSDHQELQWNGSKSKDYPDTYSLTSKAPVIDEALLRSVKDIDDPASFEATLQLPKALPQRVRDLAQQITSSAVGPYDKAKSIEQYLKTNYLYNNKPESELIPNVFSDNQLNEGRYEEPSKDFVDRFLFQTLQGYCDHFSTAMVVLTRSIGIPARWVKGFATGQLNTPGSNMLDPTARPTDVNGVSTYTVRNADAHSWVEVYFEDAGWIPFEPTAGFALPQAVPDNTTEEPEPEPEVQPEPTEPVIEKSQVQDATVWAIVVGSLAAAILIGGTIYFSLRYRFASRLRRKLRYRHANTVNEQIVIEFNRLLRLCLKNGFVRRDSETIRESFTRWSAGSPYVLDELTEALAIFEQAKYGYTALSELELARMVAQIHKLKKKF